MATVRERINLVEVLLSEPAAWMAPAASVWTSLRVIPWFRSQLSAVEFFTFRQRVPASSGASSSPKRGRTYSFPLGGFSLAAMILGAAGFFAFLVFVMSQPG